MKEESRRRIARMFLEENFGKKMVIDTEGFYFEGKPFELWRDYDSAKDGEYEVRAFQVLFAPYLSSAKKRMIAVSDNEKELHEIVRKSFEENSIKCGLVEYEEYKGYKVAYD